MKIDEYDGFYFLPPDEEDADYDDLKMVFFTKENKTLDDVSTKMPNNGYWFHVVFVKEDDEGKPKFDSNFEAIFLDPIEYVKGLIGSNLYGVILKKTEKSKEWIDKYIDDTEQKITELN